MTRAVADIWERVESRPVAINGDNLVAEAMRQTNPDLVAAYPITPQTIMIETFSEFVHDGLVDTEFVAVESEHSAMSVCIGAAAAGGRVQTATTSQGLALMWEMLYIASGMRLPIVMHMANRALSAPINIHCDHSDAMGARDSGWVQLFAENGQEAYDNALQAVRIAEHPDVMLPVMHGQDGFTVTHSVERAEVLPDDAARRFIGEYAYPYALLNFSRPVTHGPVGVPQYYSEFKRQQAEAMEKALSVIEAVGQEYGQLSGRHYGFFEGYRLDDADYVMVVIGSTAGTARIAVDMMREQGIAAGVLKLRCYRPFPTEMVAVALRGRKAVTVMDRAMAFGAPGNPLYLDICAAMVAHGVSVPIVNYVYGLGGRDTVPSQLCQVFQDLVSIDKTGVRGPVVRYLGLRE